MGVGVRSVTLHIGSRRLLQAKLDEYGSRLRSYDDNCAFFEANPQLMHEHAMGYLLMEALHLGMDNRMVRPTFWPLSLPIHAFLTTFPSVTRRSRRTCDA